METFDSSSDAWQAGTETDNSKAAICANSPDEGVGPDQDCRQHRFFPVLAFLVLGKDLFQKSAILSYLEPDNSFFQDEIECISSPRHFANPARLGVGINWQDYILLLQWSGSMFNRCGPHVLLSEMLGMSTGWKVGRYEYKKVWVKAAISCFHSHFLFWSNKRQTFTNSTVNTQFLNFYSSSFEFGMSISAKTITKSRTHVLVSDSWERIVSNLVKS